MKVNELMIDDWVCNSALNEVFKMNTASMRNMCWDEDNGMARYTIDPIPLTEEILKANRFQPFGDDYVLEIKERNSRFKLERQHRSKWYIVLCGVRQYIYYVHELQHALRLCELDELADNFKIE